MLIGQLSITEKRTDCMHVMGFYSTTKAHAGVRSLILMYQLIANGYSLYGLTGGPIGVRILLDTTN